MTKSKEANSIALKVAAMLEADRVHTTNSSDFNITLGNLIEDIYKLAHKAMDKHATDYKLEYACASSLEFTNQLDGILQDIASDLIRKLNREMNLYKLECLMDSE